MRELDSVPQEQVRRKCDQLIKPILVIAVNDFECVRPLDAPWYLKFRIRIFNTTLPPVISVESVEIDLDIRRSILWWTEVGPGKCRLIQPVVNDPNEDAEHVIAPHKWSTSRGCVLDHVELFEREVLDELGFVE